MKLESKLVLAVAVVATLAACSPKGEKLYARAEQSLGAGEVNAAVIDLKNLVKDEPENAKARALLASAYVQAGDFSAAAIEVQKAKDLGATAETVFVPDCYVKVSRSEFQQALDQCLPEKATPAAKPDIQIVQGRALLGLERAVDAKPQFAAALAARPESLDALLGLASATYALEGLPAAKDVMAKASPAIEKKSQYWMAMGGINAQGGDLAAAEAAYQKALDITGKGGDGGSRLMALGALAETQMRLGKIDQAKATAALLAKAAPNNPLAKQLRGKVAAAGGNYDEARTLLEEAVAAMPENNQARTMLGLVNLQQGNLGQAEMHFQSVLAKEPNNVPAQQLLAETRAKQGTPEEGLKSLQSSLTAENTDPSLLATAGRMSLASGDRAQALEYFNQASAKTGDAQSSIEIANGYVMAGDLDRAIEVLEKMPSGGATDLQRELLLATALLRKGENAKAIAQADQLVARQGSDPQVRSLAAAIYAATGQPDKARAQLNEALKLKPNDPAALLNLARLDLSTGKSADADKSFQKLLEADPKNLMATVGLAASAQSRGDNAGAEKWLKKASADHADSVEAQLALAQFYMGTNDFGKAKAVIDAAAVTNPDNAALSNARGLTLMGLKDVPGALASFKQATTQAPKAYGYALNLARGHIVNKDVDSALGVVDDILKSEPKYAPALAFGAATALQAGQLEKATGYVERLRQAAPEATGTFALEGDLAMAQKRYKDALGHYRKASAIGANSQLTLAQYNAAVLAKEPQPEKILQDWVAKYPSDINAVTMLAESYQRAGNTSGAIALYEKSLAKAPDSVVLLNNLAMIYVQTDVAKAADYAGRAYKAMPKAPAIADTYGWILFKQGKTDEALAPLREANKGLPNNAEVQYHLAAALAAKGEKAEALPLIKKAMSGQLPADEKAGAQKLLEQLSK